MVNKSPEKEKKPGKKKNLKEKRVIKKKILEEREEKDGLLRRDILPVRKSLKQFCVLSREEICRERLASKTNRR